MLLPYHLKQKFVTTRQSPRNEL